jgi:hypothetical protein
MTFTLIPIQAGLTNASKLSSTSPSHGVLACERAPPSASTASPKRRSCFPAFRSLYFETMFGATCGVVEVAKPNLKLVEPLSITNGVCAVRCVSYGNVGGIEGWDGIGRGKTAWGTSDVDVIKPINALNISGQYRGISGPATLPFAILLFFQFTVVATGNCYARSTSLSRITGAFV